MLPHKPGRWTARSGRTWDQIVADDTLANFPKNAPNALVFRRCVSDPAVDPVAPKTTGRTLFMRGMQRLANLAPTIMAALDLKADAACDKLAAEQARAEVAIEQYGALANSLGQVADNITSALGQITNDPTKVSGA
jgi:hypothetical protein